MESTSPEAFAYDCCLMVFFQRFPVLQSLAAFLLLFCPHCPHVKGGAQKKRYNTSNAPQHGLSHRMCGPSVHLEHEGNPAPHSAANASQKKYGAHSLRRRVFLRWIERLRWTRVIPPCRAGGREEASRGKFRTDRPGGPCRMRSLSASSYSARYGLVVVGRVVVTGGGWRHEGGRRRGGIN